MGWEWVSLHVQLLGAAGDFVREQISVDHTSAEFGCCCSGVLVVGSDWVTL